MFKNLKISARMAMGSGLLMLLMAAVAGLAAYDAWSTAKGLAQLQQYNRLAQLAQKWADNNAINNDRVFNLVVSGNQAALAKHLKPLMADIVRENDSLLAQLQQGDTSEQGKQALADIGVKRLAFQGSRKKVFEALDAGQNEQGLQLQEQLMKPAMNAFRASVAAFVELQQQRAHQFGESLQQTSARNLQMLGLVFVLAMVLGALSAIWIARSITRPLGYAIRVLEQVADGDLSTSLRVTRQDEVGALQKAAVRMQQSLREMVGQLQEVAQHIQNNANDVAQGTQELAERTESTASNLEQTAASMEQFSATIKQNADAAAAANQKAETAVTVAQRSRGSVDAVAHNMQSITEGAQRVGEVISVIDSIAFQTNILALNAAVEAARAGDQGRSFAVVAAEVRSLAQRAADAAKEIRDLITRSIEQAQHGTQVVQEATRTMNELSDSVHQVAELISVVTNASAEQTIGVEQVNQAVNNLDQMTQRNAGLVDASTAATSQLRNQADQLSQLVAGFRLP